MLLNSIQGASLVLPPGPAARGRKGDLRVPKNNVGIHYEHGPVLEGTVTNFLPQKPVFHLTVAGTRERLKKL